MKTRASTLQIVFSLLLSFAFISCESDDFYEKEFLERPLGQSPIMTPVPGGSGINVTERFHQSSDEAKKLDIIWIVDNSGSMSDEQAALADNFEAFIEEFITRNVDFKMAITTTDVRVAYRGLMVPGSDTALTSMAAANDSLQFISDFKRMVNVGIRGSGSEQGLEAAKGFMERYSTSFIRQDAYLAVVIISDEEDQSPQVVSHYTDLLKSHKSEAGLVKVYTIVDTGRTNSGSGITTGYERYALASNHTAGTVSNIRNDFHTTLVAMGDSIIELLDSFALGFDPIPGTLRVYVNNLLVSDYTFDASSRSIRFDPNRLPPVGAEIRVEYMR